MRRSFTTLLLLLAFGGAVSAREADHGRLLPEFSKDAFDTQNIYVGAEGRFCLPVGFTGEQKLTGFGGGFALEAGYDWDGWLLSGRAGLSGYGEGFNEDYLMDSFTHIPLTLEASKLFGKKIIPFMPSWLDIRAESGIGIDIFITDYYKSVTAKKNGEKTHKAGAVQMFNLGCALEYNALPHHWIPYFAFNLDMENDRKGVMFMPSFALGVRKTLGKASAEKETEDKTEPPAEQPAETAAAPAETAPAAEQTAPAGEAPAEKPAPAVMPSFTLAVSPEDFTPDGDGVNDTLTIATDGDYGAYADADSWKLEVLSPSGAVFKTLGGTGAVPASVSWDGKGDSGESVQSATDYSVNLTVTAEAAEDSADGTVKKGSVKTVRAGTTAAVGVLVEKTDDGMKILVPSIAFDADAATFRNIGEEAAAKNRAILDQVADILKKYGDYSVAVEGHANNTSGTEKEEVEELIPLSQARADAVKAELVSRGINGSRMTTAGKGGRFPVSTDKAEGWKNRRVEFILRK